MKSWLAVLTLFFLPLTTKAKPFEDDKLAVKAGGGFHTSWLKNTNGTRKSLPGLSLSPQVSHRMGPYLELGVMGFLRLGKSQELSFEVDQKTLKGDVRPYDVMISPQLRTYLPAYFNRENWQLYVTAGPSWSLHTFDFRNNTGARDAGFDTDTSQYKLAYATYGWIAGIGVQEITAFKEMHPVYIELLYSTSRTRKVTLLDTTKFYKTNEVFSGTDRRYRSHSIILQMGITLF